MTVITEINNKNLHQNNINTINDIKYAIANNDPIEEKLNVIVVISNPCLYEKRYILFNEFVNRFQQEESNINLYVVELIYKNQTFIVTDKNNKKHLQIKTDTPIWHKENMINLGVKKLLPSNWKAFAWIDADIEFESNTWALDTLKILNGSKDVLQIFSHCVDMNKNKQSLNHFNSFGYCFSKNKDFNSINCKNVLDYWHPGFAWAITRKAYEKIGGLYDKAILGSGDNIMALSFVNKICKTQNIEYSDDYNKSMFEFQEKAKYLRLGYTPGVIRHYYHGSKKNRKYTERWEILKNNNYSPIQHLKYDTNGILVPSYNFTEDFKRDILQYFIERKEDE